MIFGFRSILVFCVVFLVFKAIYWFVKMFWVKANGLKNKFLGKKNTDSIFTNTIVAGIWKKPHNSLSGIFHLRRYWGRRHIVDAVKHRPSLLHTHTHTHTHTNNFSFLKKSYCFYMFFVK
jgi:hypothetical protein